MTKSDPVNATVKKFGHPQTLLATVGAWQVLVRPKQATLGALVLAHSGPAERFSDLAAIDMTDLGTAVRRIETALAGAFAYDKINYLMLMMVDPHVHFHVLPRYARPRDFEGTSFADSGWPGPPDLGAGHAADAALIEALRTAIRSHWPDG